MPGILPMKVIKIGTQAQARIAQACDRCRSKKIRCDGIRPSCSQCLNVGFECKTSDKLSRRAFPRGYTESLEERVRSLEAEVRELKALLDEKDENIDVLSRIHSHSQNGQPRRRSFSTPTTQDPIAQERDEVFKVIQSPTLVDNELLESYFMGPSSGRNLVEAFNDRLQESRRSGQDIDSTSIFTPENKLSNFTSQPVVWKAPARLVSDQLINIFFQEWAPLFPILHRPTFLSLYEEYVADSEALEDKKSLAQLHLVFSIAAHSSSSQFSQEIESFDSQWQAAIEEILTDASIATLQDLLLAQICCLQKGDHPRLLKFKGLSISLSQRLGLHQSQKQFAFGALTSETRKKLFWTLYTLDCFSAAQLGLPRILKDEDAQCEYPVDADDEYVTEKGFLPTLPGEFTKLSSALALFKVSRILAKVLSENYPSTASYELSFRALEALSDELDQWHNNLPAHLRLQFVQDKPSTNVISSRSPLLSLGYHYIRSLIFRPAVCASYTIGDRAGSATLAVAASSKHIVQILELLDERTLAFSFCLNKNDLLVLSGFGLLFQSLAHEGGGSSRRNNQKLVHSIADILEQSPSPASKEFRRISNILVPRTETTTEHKTPILSRHNSDGQLNSTQDAFSSIQKHTRSIMSRFSTSKSNRADGSKRRTALPAVGFSQRKNQSQASLSSTHSEPATARSEPTLSPQMSQSSLSPTQFKNSNRSNSTWTPTQTPNLDYLPLGTSTTTTPAYPYIATTPNNLSKPQITSTTDWERLLSSLDNGQTNIYDTIYGGPQIALSQSTTDWSTDVWAIDNTQPPPQSVLSFSDESLTSGEEFPELSHCNSNGDNTYRSILIPEIGSCSPEALGLDGNFGL